MRADRLVSLTLLLQTRPKMTAGELARELEVSERTIHRDLDALSGAGVPVYATRGSAGGVALMEGWRTQLTGFTRAELHALAAVAAPGALDDLGLTSALRSGLVKMAASCPHSSNPRWSTHASGFTWMRPRGFQNARPCLIWRRCATRSGRTAACP